MLNKTGKTLKNLLYGIIPITVASFLPVKEANGQMIKKGAFSRWDAIEQKRIEKPNEIYLDVQLNLQPIQGLGVGYSRKITKKFGTYLFLSKGRYVSPYRYASEDFKNSHVDYFNISLGCLVHSIGRDENNSTGFLVFGPSYNFLDKKHYVPGSIAEKGLRKLSFEGGGGATVSGVSIGFLFNSNIESKVFVGIPFGRH